jgi:uncharacterized protein YdaU (DUF1376 family)
MPRDKTGHFYFAWFPTIYQQDTQHLTLAECGAYRRLIDHYMMTRSPLPCSDKALARIVGCGVDEWVPISENVKAFFKAKEGFLHHKFCDETIAGDTARILKAQLNGSRGGRPSASKDEGITQSVTESNPVGSPNPTITTKTTQNISSHQDQGRGEGEGFLQANGFKVGGEVRFSPSLKTCDRLLGVAPGWDQHRLIDLYNEWLKGKDRPKFPDAAFLGWAQKFTKGRRPL